MRLSTFSLSVLALAMLSASVVADAQNASSLAGRWEGTLVPNDPRSRSRELSQRRVVPKVSGIVIITTASDGTYVGTWVGPGENDITRIGEIAIDGDTIRISVPARKGSWEGKLSADGSTLEGQWRQSGSTSPLVLRRSGNADDGVTLNSAKPPAVRRE